MAGKMADLCRFVIAAHFRHPPTTRRASRTRGIGYMANLYKKAIPVWRIHLAQSPWLAGCRLCPDLLTSHVQAPIEKATRRPPCVGWGNMLEYEWILAPVQGIVGEFLQTFKEFPPRMKAASFTIGDALDKLQPNTGLHADGSIQFTSAYMPFLVW